MPLDEWRRQTDIILTGAFLFHQARRPSDDRAGNAKATSSTSSPPPDTRASPATSATVPPRADSSTSPAPWPWKLSPLRHPRQQPDPPPPPTSPKPASGPRDGAWDWPAPRLGQRAAGLLPDASRGAPLLRLPGPSHYGKAAVFLASDDAEMITGFDLRVDAGAVSRYWIWSPGDA